MESHNALSSPVLLPG